MPFERPSLRDLVTQIEADIETRLPGADARAPRSVLNVLARVSAGGLHSLYGYMAWLAEQILPDTAEREQLDRHGAIWGLTRKPAVAATGTVTFTGSAGTIPAGTLLRRSDGATYATTASAVIDGGIATATVTAEAAGAAGNAVAGTSLALVTPIAGVNTEATVAAEGLVLGSDEESDSSLRGRLVARIQAPPHGGARHDYEAWATAQNAHGVPVTRAWVFPQELGIGTVTVRIMTDGATADGIPDAAAVATVQAYVDSVRPVTAEVFVVAPTPAPLTVEIAGLSPDTAAVRAAIEAELRDLIRREAEPGGTILLSHIREAISISAGEADHVLVSPAADVMHGTGEIATFGGVTWS